SDVDHSDYNDITFYRWSPDSRWLAYTKNNVARFSVIYVVSVPDMKSYRLTSGMTDDNEPTFDPKGRYLYFTSNRDFNLTFSAFEFNYVYTDPLRIYAGILAADGPALLLPQSDEEKGAPVAEKKPPASGTEKEAAGEKKPAATANAGEEGTHKAASPTNVKIDAEGFERRVRAIPGPAGNYNSLSAVNNGVIYMVGTRGSNTLRLYNLDDRKEETIVEGLRGYDISADGQKLIIHTGADYAIVA